MLGKVCVSMLGKTTEIISSNQSQYKYKYNEFKFVMKLLTQLRTVHKKN